MQKYIVIVAGGMGKRMEMPIPKQFLEVNGRPILFYTIEKFFQHDNSINIYLVLPADHIDYWKTLCEKFNFPIKHKIVAGGSERFYSVKNAIDTIEGEGLVGIHDGVRPFVSAQTIEACYNTALEKGNAIPVVKLSDSIRQVSQNSSEAVSRKNFRIVQTPQCFKLRLLKKAYQQPFNDFFTDDASVLESFGEKINLVEGNFENIKITTQFDLYLAEAIIKDLR